MSTYYKDYQRDPLEEMLKQLPLEQPPRHFTEKVMRQVQSIEVANKVYFYQKPLFISMISIGFAACFLLFYHADFSLSVLLKQLGHYYILASDYLSSLHFAPRQITFSPVIVAPLLLIGCIFIADRALETYKRSKQPQVFCI
ncbi:MAG: hypothetical protein FWG84_02465 [Bacteroidales bacterium]|nr:hypothetical protein [Bacteroidales bacterium]